MLKRYSIVKGKERAEWPPLGAFDPPTKFSLKSSKDRDAVAKKDKAEAQCRNLGLEP